MGGKVAWRMTSLLPRPHGSGGRNNKEKSEYVLRKIADVEYRTVACDTWEEAKGRENELRENKSAYVFKT
jgi:hypothetical protein